MSSFFFSLPASDPMSSLQHGAAPGTRAHIPPQARSSVGKIHSCGMSFVHNVRTQKYDVPDCVPQMDQTTPKTTLTLRHCDRAFKIPFSIMDLMQVLKGYNWHIDDPQLLCLSLWGFFGISIMQSLSLEIKTMAAMGFLAVPLSAAMRQFFRPLMPVGVYLTWFSAYR